MGKRPVFGIKRDVRGTLMNEKFEKSWRSLVLNAAVEGLTRRCEFVARVPHTCRLTPLGLDFADYASLRIFA